MDKRNPLDLSEPEPMPEGYRYGVVIANAMLALSLMLLGISFGWALFRGVFA